MCRQLPIGQACICCVSEKSMLPIGSIFLPPCCANALGSQAGHALSTWTPQHYIVTNQCGAKLLYPPPSKAVGLHGFLIGVAASPHGYNVFPQAAKQGIRDSWAAWNPQRRSAHQLQQLLQSGQLTLQDTISAQRQAGANAQHEPLAGSIPPADAEARGWYAHPKPFAWPAAKDSQVSCAT